MTTVKEILEAKGREVWSVSPDATVGEAIRVLARNDVGALLVVEEGKVLGIFSERDLARRMQSAPGRIRETPVRDIMRSPVHYVTPERTIEECMALMTDRRIRHLPVLEEGRLAGVVSIGDVVKAVMSEKDFLIGQLTHYIAGA